MFREISGDAFTDDLLAGSPDLADRLLARVVGPLEAYGRGRGPDLVTTLAVYVAEGCDRRRSADRLVVHPNTLDYRLRRIEQLIRLRFDVPADLVLVLLALRWRATRDLQERSA